MWRRTSGFTLIELMMTISIIGILAAMAIPSYARYINEAKAAEVLMHIHRISLAYLDTSYQEASNQQPSHYYDSPDWGQAPAAFPNMDALYSTKYGLTMASYVVSNSQHVASVTGGSRPVLFIKAPDTETQALLYALDHILQHDHSFPSPSLMIVPLTNFQTTAASSSTPTAVTASTTTTGTTITPTASSTSTTATGTTTTTGSSSNNHGASSNHAGNPSSGPSTSSSLPPECYRHPGWIKNHLHGC